jgi:putative spermidine/putrescine transport system substrate-binding protein
VGIFSKDRTDAIEALTSGDAVVGLAGPDVLDSLSRGGRPVGAGAPKEGATGWLDSWMIATGAQHPNCMYQWLDWTSTPATQAEAAEWRGAAPANAEACPTLPSGFCTAYRVSEKAYLDKLHFVRAPTKDCAGDKQSCTDWKDWTLAWTTAK